MFTKYFNTHITDVFYKYKPLLYFSSVCISVSLSKYVFKYFRNNKTITTVDPNKKYIDRYKEKLDNSYKSYCCNIVNKSLKEETNFSSNSIIFETTPRGNVIMKYNNDTNSIEYFCDFFITNDMLRTVFQKFVLTFKYFPLYYGTFEVIKDYNDDSNKKLTQNNDDKSYSSSSSKKKLSKMDKNNPVFAKFKKYKDVNKDKDKDKDNKQIKNYKPFKNEIQEKNYFDFNYSIKRIGKISDAKLFIPQNTKSSRVKKISFSEFKKNM